MIPVSAFLDKVKEIAARPLTYRTGGSGKDGTCDCIGLIMGAMQELGHPGYDMHSTNYFARYQMDSLVPADSPVPGCIVYKTRVHTGQLNERYQPGGRYDTGDGLDYYHAGVVESTDPLVIVHCTTSGSVNGITRDFEAGDWSHMGRLKGIFYEETDSAKNAEAIVAAGSGKTVNLRSRPSMEGLLYMRVPIGTKVSVYETAKNDAGESWSRVSFNGMSGYMKTEFLSTADRRLDDAVLLRISGSAAAELRRALAEVTDG